VKQLSVISYQLSVTRFAILLFFSLFASGVCSQTFDTSKLLVVVNSNQDGEIRADEAMTLREAIAIVNGTLPIEQLSGAEKAQVKISRDVSRIEFNLPPGQTAIALQKELPALATPGLTVDGTTQPGYNSTPLVTIAPAKDKEILRGLTIVANRAIVRGLNLYGFTSKHHSTATTPPADIFIAPPHNENFSVEKDNIPPQGVVIEDNWLGVLPDGNSPEITSAFGVSAFNSRDTTIQRNTIAHHDGSGIITSVRAENLQVKENLIVNNGLAGMPDAIRLEGTIANTQVSRNKIRDNAGSAIYLFKSEGAIKIQDNLISNNGKRFERAAIYLMGDGHLVANNQIQAQSGPGVVVTAFPVSRGNQIIDNQFSRLGGLSIDLVSEQSVSPQDYQKGDGVNPVAAKLEI
jgi:parallel beta-helix repeat protein